MCILSTISPKPLQPLRINDSIHYLDQLQLTLYSGVNCNLYCIYFRLVVYIATCAVYIQTRSLYFSYRWGSLRLAPNNDIIDPFLMSTLHGVPVLFLSLLTHQNLVTIAGGLKSLFAARLLIGYKVSVQFARVVQFQACCLRRELLLLLRTARAFTDTAIASSGFFSAMCSRLLALYQLPQTSSQPSLIIARYTAE